MTGETSSIAGAETAPAEQFEVRTDATRIRRLAVSFQPAAVVVVSGFDERIVLFSDKGQRFFLFGLDILYFFGRILLDPALFDAKIEKSNDPLMLIVACSGGTVPGTNPTPQRRDVKLREQKDRRLLCSTPGRQPAQCKRIFRM